MDCLGADFTYSIKIKTEPIKEALIPIPPKIQAHQPSKPITSHIFKFSIIISNADYKFGNFTKKIHLKVVDKKGKSFLKRS